MTDALPSSNTSRYGFASIAMVAEVALSCLAWTVRVGGTIGGNGFTVAEDPGGGGTTIFLVGGTIDGNGCTVAEDAGGGGATVFLVGGTIGGNGCTVAEDVGGGGTMVSLVGGGCVSSYSASSPWIFWYM